MPRERRVAPRGIIAYCALIPSIARLSWTPETPGGSRPIHSFVERMTSSVSAARPVVRGKFLFRGEQKLFVRGVTYGTFAPQPDGLQFPSSDRIAQDFFDAEVEHDAVAAVKLDGVLRNLHDFFRGKHFGHVDENFRIRCVFVDRLRRAIEQRARVSGIAERGRHARARLLCRIGVCLHLAERDRRLG